MEKRTIYMTDNDMLVLIYVPESEHLSGRLAFRLAQERDEKAAQQLKNDFEHIQIAELT